MSDENKAVHEAGLMNIDRRLEKAPEGNSVSVDSGVNQSSLNIVNATNSILASLKMHR